MHLPPFVIQEAADPHPVYFVDLAAELNALLVWIYATAKRNVFPLTLRVAGGPVTFESSEGLVGFAIGIKRAASLACASGANLFDDTAGYD